MEIEHRLLIDVPDDTRLPLAFYAGVLWRRERA
jgi:hypothetical protein